MSTWHYMKNGTQTGPVSTDELRALFTSGSLSGETLVWREGLAVWAAAKTQPEFASAVPATPPPPPAGAGVPAAPLSDAADVEQNKVFAILGYFGILFLVPLLAARQSKFAMYHCNQGLVLFICAIAGWIVNMILSALLVFIPVLGVIIIMLLHFGLIIGVLILAIMGIINAANGVCKPLPVIGNRFTLIK